MSCRHARTNSKYKYAFDDLYLQLDATKQETGADPEDKDEYTAERVFYVPPQARWKWLQGRVLYTGRYINFKEVEDDCIAFDEKMKTLTATLFQQMEEEARLNKAIIENLKMINF